MSFVCKFISFQHQRHLPPFSLEGCWSMTLPMILLHNVDGVHTSEGHFLQMFFSLLGAPYMGIKEELKKKKDNQSPKI